MDYEAATDFEINKAVAEIRFPGFHWQIAPIGDGRNESLSATVTYDHEGAQGYVYDYCNNISNSWPLMMEYGIGNYRNHNGIWESESCTVDGLETTIYEHEDKNPLRAAMIVYLKMKEESCT